MISRCRALEQSESGQLLLARRLERDRTKTLQLAAMTCSLEVELEWEKEYRPLKAAATLLRRAARAEEAADGGPPADGGFEDWLIVRHRLRLSSTGTVAAVAPVLPAADGGLENSGGFAPVTIRTMWRLRGDR
jgi:hypothetical protein